MSQFNFKGKSFDDVLLRPKKSVLNSRKEADISVDFFKEPLDVPFLAAPMPSVVDSTLARELDRLGGLAVLHRFCSIQEQGEMFLNARCFPAVAIGIHDGLARTKYFVEELQADTFFLDVAHAHSDPVLEFIKYWKEDFSGDAWIVAGNVATAQGANDLIDAGADAIKVGIGPGSVCTTRQVTGFGIPQLQAINEVASKMLYKVPIIADGGIRDSGDIVKALAAGADLVMIGSLFAHSKEAPNDGQHYGNASSIVSDHRAPEGMNMTITVDKEPLEDIVKRLAWGLKSGISYGGARNIRELQKNAEWIKLTDAGRKESKL